MLVGVKFPTTKCKKRQNLKTRISKANISFLCNFNQSVKAFETASSHAQNQKYFFQLFFKTLSLFSEFFFQLFQLLRKFHLFFLRVRCEW